MKIAFFDTKSYWKDSFEPMAKKYGYEITFFNERLTPATAHLAAGHDATCSFVNDEVPAEVIRELKNLGIKVLLLRCAGFDSVDLEVAKECGLPVLRVPAYSPESVAEQGAALLMAVNRKPHLSYERTTKFNFDIAGLEGIALVGKTAGVIGTGKIGLCMINILKGFGMKIIAYDAFPNPNLDLEYVTLDELYAQDEFYNKSRWGDEPFASFGDTFLNCPFIFYTLVKKKTHVTELLKDWTGQRRDRKDERRRYLH